MKSIFTYALTLFCIICSYAAAATTTTTTKPGMEQTLSLIKPDAVSTNHIGDIIGHFERAGLHVVALKMERLTTDQAQQFYSVHKDKPFFKDLVTFMTSGPLVAMVLEGNNAIVRNRQLMGSTDYSKAMPGTVRAAFARSLTENAVHGSDSAETAKTEIAFFFQPSEIMSRQ